LEIAHPRFWEMVAYIEDIDFGLVHLAAEATFYPEGADFQPIRCQVTNIAQVPSDYLDEPSLASINGGRISVTMDRKERLVPTTSIYRVVLVAPFSDAKDLQHLLRGTVVIKGDQSSVLSRIWRMVLTVLTRESGF
jgi:putative peptide zinc metalloprotease protein